VNIIIKKYRDVLESMSFNDSVVGGIRKSNINKLKKDPIVILEKRFNSKLKNSKKTKDVNTIKYTNNPIPKSKDFLLSYSVFLSIF